MIPRSELAVVIASDHHFGGHLDPRSSGLDVGKFVLGLAAAAMRLGTTLHEAVTVSAITAGAGDHAVQTSAGVVRAKQVLLATNLYTDRSVPYFHGAWCLSGRHRSPPSLWPSQWRASSRPALGWRPIPATSSPTFGSHQIDGSSSAAAAYGFSEERSDRASAATLRSKIAEIFPSLRNVRIEYSWSGPTGFTVDRVPHAGEHDGVYYSLGYSGHGVQMSTYMGRQMSEVMGGKPGANPWRAFQLRPIPLYVGRPWFLPLSRRLFQNQGLDSLLPEEKVVEL